MGLRNALGKLFGNGQKERPGGAMPPLARTKPLEPPSLPPTQPADQADLLGYEDVKKPDQDLYEACTRLKTIADDLVTESGRHPPEATAQVEAITAACSKAATDWINTHYKLHSFLADAYGKSWLDSPIGKDALMALGKATAVSDPEVGASLSQGMQLIAIAVAAMMVRGLLVMAHNPQADEATKTVADMAAAAKTYALGL